MPVPRAMPKFVKTPPEMVAAFDAASPSRPDIQRKTMFSYPALFVNGNMFAFTFGPHVCVRLSEEGRAKALKAGARPFEPMPGRGMKEYVEVPASDLGRAALKRWFAHGLAYGESLPPKGAKAAKPARTTKAAGIGKNATKATRRSPRPRTRTSAPRPPAPSSRGASGDRRRPTPS